jgi:hypothetical protein
MPVEKILCHLKVTASERKRYKDEQVRILEGKSVSRSVVFFSTLTTSATKPATLVY